MTIVFIAFQLSQPRCIKRISAIYDAGFDVKVYGFDSGLYNESLKTLPFPVERIIKRDKTAGRLNKLYSLSAQIRRILSENKKDCLFYLFGYEIAFFAKLNGCKRYVYEEADVTASREKRKWLKKILINIDKHIIQKSRLTIFTSQGFVDYLFGSERVDDIVLQPNKLAGDFFDEKRRQAVIPRAIDPNHLLFGFVGLIRYPNTIMRFAKIIGKYYPQHEFHFYGTLDRADFWDEELDSYHNVYNHGPFKNPVDQPEIYSKFDISVVCYDTASDNVKIAEPNKLYESIFFGIPMVVSANCFLAERVRELGVGYSIDASKDEAIRAFIEGLKVEELILIKDRMREIPLADIIDSTEELIDRLKQIQL